MGRARTADPIQQFRFRIEIEGISELGFTRMSGLEDEIEVAEYREGGFDTTHKLPGLETTGVVTLERGATRDLQLYEWYRDSLCRNNTQDFRKTVTIIETDCAGNEIRRHVLYEAWASKFTRPEFDATSSEVAIDTIEIQYEQSETIAN